MTVIFNKVYLRAVFLAATGVLVLNNPAYPNAEVSRNPAFTDNVIGSTFKTLAKAFVSAADIEQIKKDNIEKIRRMDEAKFRRRYAKIYDTIKDCPFLKGLLGEERQDKQGIVNKIKSLDKKRIFEVLDSVPNAFIAGQFKLYLKEKKDRMQTTDVAVQIRKLWDRMAAGARR